MAEQGENSPNFANSDKKQRLDKWLWFARVVKSRTLAAGLVTGGKVRINRVRIVKPAHLVRTGDVLTVSVGRGVRVIKVVAGGVRRGPAREAALLYDEILPLSTPRISALRRGGGSYPPLAHVAKAGHSEGVGPVMAAGSGRPTKKNRRLMDRLRKLNET